MPEVDKAAFSLPKGGTSDVINAGYAFVILHIDDKQSAHVKTLDEVKGQIEPSIKQQKATEAADSEANALVSQARAEGLDKAAAAKGLQVVSTDFLSRTDSLPGNREFAPIYGRGFRDSRQISRGRSAIATGLRGVPSPADSTRIYADF